MIEVTQAANDTIKDELIEAIKRAWGSDTGGLYTRVLSGGKRYHIMSEDRLASEKNVSARRSEKAVLDRLRALPDDVINKATAAFYTEAPMGGSSMNDCMQNAVTAVADELEAKR